MQKYIFKFIIIHQLNRIKSKHKLKFNEYINNVTFIVCRSQIETSRRDRSPVYVYREDRWELWVNFLFDYQSTRHNALDD